MKAAREESEARSSKLKEMMLKESLLWLVLVAFHASQVWTSA